MPEPSANWYFQPLGPLATTGRALTVLTSMGWAG
jgi:hypothetical protein